MNKKHILSFVAVIGLVVYITHQRSRLFAASKPATTTPAAKPAATTPAATPAATTPATTPAATTPVTTPAVTPTAPTTAVKAPSTEAQAAADAAAAKAAAAANTAAALAAQQASYLAVMSALPNQIQLIITGLQNKVADIEVQAPTVGQLTMAQIQQQQTNANQQIALIETSFGITPIREALTALENQQKVLAGKIVALDPGDYAALQANISSAQTKPDVIKTLDQINQLKENLVASIQPQVNDIRKKGTVIKQKTQALIPEVLNLKSQKLSLEQQLVTRMNNPLYRSQVGALQDRLLALNQNRLSSLAQMAQSLRVQARSTNFGIRQLQLLLQFLQDPTIIENTDANQIGLDEK